MIDTRLPMMIQQPNVLAALDAGTQAAGNQNALMRQAEGQNLFRQFGAGAMQGDPRAMNALAGFDPAMAQDMQAGQLSMDLTREQIAGVRRQASEAARAQQDAATAMAELEQSKGMMRFAGQAFLTQDQDTWNAVTSEFGVSGIPMDERGLAFLDAIVGGFEDGLSGIAPQGQGQEFGFSDGMFYDKNNPAAGAQPIPGMPQGGQQEVIFGPDGQPIVARGPAGADIRFTEGQSKDNVYATRAEGALSLLDSVGADALTDRASIIAESVPLGLARGLQTEDFQVARQAGDEFLQAILRKDTGAAITQDEQVLYGKTYLPQPGDRPEVLEAKRQARIRAIEAIRAGMNASQIAVSDRALVQAAERSGGEGQTAPGSGSIPIEPPRAAVGLLQQDPSPEARREFDEAFGAGAAARVLGQ